MTNVLFCIPAYLKSAGSNLISRIVRKNFANIMTLNNWGMIAETQKLHFRVTFLLPSTSCLLSSLFFSYS